MVIKIALDMPQAQLKPQQKNTQLNQGFIKRNFNSIRLFSESRGVTRKFTGRRQLPPQIVCMETTPTNYRVEAHANGRKLLFTCSPSLFFINKTVIELISAHSIYLVS